MNNRTPKGVLAPCYSRSKDTDNNKLYREAEDVNAKHTSHARCCTRHAGSVEEFSKQDAERACAKHQK